MNAPSVGSRGRLTAIGGFRGDPDPQAEVTVTLWDVPRRRPVAAAVTSEETPVDRMAFSPDGRILATVSPSGAKLWKVG
jgi:WD40 repeat protein